MSQQQQQRLSTWGAIATILLIFSLTCVFLYFLIKILIPVEEAEMSLIQIPKNIDDLKALSKLARSYLDKQYWGILVVFCSVYVFLQSFAIPGSLPLGVLAGALFKLPLGLLLVSACSAIGAFNCYLLSQFIGKSLIHSVTTTTSPSRKKKSNKFSQRLEFLKGQLEKYRHSLFSYMILLRVTPIIPNWFINIAAPHVGVDGGVFFWGTFIGVAPLSMLHIQAGETIEKLSNLSEATSITSVFTNKQFLIVTSMAVCIPLLLNNLYPSKAKQR